MNAKISVVVICVAAIIYVEALVSFQIINNE